MNVILVTQEKNILVEHSTSYESSLIGDKALGSVEEVFFSEELKTNNITISLCLVDEVHNPIPWTVEARNKILNWMVTKEFKPFISEDTPEVIYYLKCVGVKKEFSHNMTGLLTLTMQPISPYAYTPIIIQKHMSNDSKIMEFSIDNVSNINDFYYPEIEITSLEDNESIEIYNMTYSNAPFIINNLGEKEVVTIDGLFKTVTNNNNESKLTDCNREWIKLSRGKNFIRVKGSCQIAFKCQFPMII